jgi:hypothetical protein
MLNPIMLSVIMLNVVMLSVVMLSVIMLNLAASSELFQAINFRAQNKTKTALKVITEKWQGSILPGTKTS